MGPRPQKYILKKNVGHSLVLNLPMTMEGALVCSTCKLLHHVKEVAIQKVRAAGNLVEIKA